MSARTHIAATPAELATLLQPFVGTGCEVHRGDGTAVDIGYPGALAYDADIRAVDARGVTRFFYQGCELIPWALIDRIVIRWGAASQAYVLARPVECASAERAARMEKAA